jgi:hypothetical protein
MNKKYQVFVSSTYEDLKNERQEIVEAILDAGHIPAGMEIFGGAGTIIDTIKKWINESDIYFLLLGGKYGSIYCEEDISFTEWEYRYAKSINKPVCAIVLKDSMLYAKAAIDGGESIFEYDNKEKYEHFKKYVCSNGICKMISDIKGISGAVQSHIRNVIEDDNYNLVGWIRADTILDNWDKLTDIKLKLVFSEILDSYINRIYNNIDMRDFTEKTSDGLLSVLYAKGIMNSFHRVVKIYNAKNGMIRIMIRDDIYYRYLDAEHHKIGKKFQATKEQAESYKVEKLLINRKDYTSEFKKKITANSNRGQLNYYVQSEKSIEYEEEYPVNVFYQSSYECYPEDFFQSYGLPFPCKNFLVDLIFMDDLEDKYEFIVSTNSMFSNDYSDSFISNEMKNYGECSIRLPEWSLSSAGYTASIKKKSDRA